MISRFLLFLSVVFLGIGQIWGQTTVTYDFSANGAETGLNANPPIVLDENIGFSSHKNSGTSDPGIFSDQLRLYQDQNGTKGGSIKIHAGEDVIITKVVVNASGNAGDGPAGYSVDSTTEAGAWPDGTTVYTMNNLSATNYVEFYNKGSSSSTRTYVDTFEVTYTLATSCEQSNLTFATPTVTADLVDGTFTQTATSLNETTAITYESSDEAVATVNPTTGELSLLGLGTTTITANQEAGTHNATDYCAGTVTYELTVISTEPVLIVSTNSLSLTAFAGGASATEDITIDGANLTGDIALSLTGDTNFSIDPNTLSASGGTITVTYTPSASPATHSATLTVSNGSLSEVIALSGTTNEMPAGPCVSEDFENIPTYRSSEYLTRTWTGNGGIEWTVNDSRTDQTITGKAIGLRNSTLTTTSPVAGGVGTLSFDYKRTFGGNSTLKVFVNGTQYGGDISVTSETPANFSVDVNVGENVTIELVNSGNRIAVDNLNWTCSDAAPADTHFRSQTNGDWTSTATWESSEDGLSWADATTFPGATAESVEIQAGHTVNINSASVTVTNTQVYGTLEVTTTGSYSVNGEENAVELTIENGGTFLVSSPGAFSVPDGNAWGLVKTGGKLVAGPLMGEGSGTAFANAYLGRGSGLFYFGDASVCEWANPHATLGSSAPVVGNRNFFAEYEEGDMPIFRVTVTPGHVFGNNSNDNVFHSVLEIIEPATFSVRLGSTASPQKTKTFVGGVRGSGKLIMESNSGPVIIGNSEVVPELGGTATIVTNITDNRLRFPNGANVTAGSVFTIENSENTQNIAFERQGNFDIHGTLDITNMRITNTAAGGVFVKDGGTLRTRHTDGLFGDSSAIVNATNFTMETGSTIDYYATEDQTISTGKEYYHLILSGAGTKTSSDVVNVHTAGSVTITGNPVVDFTGHNLASTSANTTSFTMDGGRLILGMGGTQPNMRGTYNLSGGVIEFTNSSASGQTIRSTNAYSYQNIEVTGNSVGTSGGNLVLNENGTFVVKPNGIFTININSIVGPEGNQTIEIEGNGTFRTGNADGFSGGDGTSNPGQTTSIRNNIENIILHPNSTVEYSRSGDQTITDGIVTTQNDAHYQNLRISGSGVKTAASGNLVVNNITYVDAATLRVAETNDDVAPNVLTARKGIQVASGATALFENNANLMQDPGAANSGKISMLRKANVPSNQYNYWASPVSGQNLYEIYNVPNNRVMIYNTDDDYFTIKPNPHQSEFGIGYSIKGPVTNEPQTPSGGIEVVANFIGTPRNESLTISENRIPLSDVGNHYNLIGNPFPSNLDLIALYNDNNSKFFDDDIEDTPTAYFWDNVSNTQMTQQGSNYNQSNYALLNLSSGIGTAAPCNSATCSGVGSDKKPNGIVKPGQGFIIRAAEGANYLTLKNDMRTTLIKRTSDDDEAVYFKTGNLSAEHNGERPRNDKFWVELVTADDLHIQAAVGYFTQAENSFERFDSKVMNEDASDNIYTLSEDDVKLSIQGRKGNFSNEDIIPLGVRFFKYGIHKIQLEETKGIFKEHQDIYVKDKYLNITHNLSANGPYLIDAQAGEFNDRFEIVFKPSLSSTVNPASPLNSLKIEKRDHQIEISSSVEKITEVEIFNLSGWSVYKAEQVNENILKIPASQFGKEIIIVNVQTESGKTETKKIINK